MVAVISPWTEHSEDRSAASIGANHLLGAMLDVGDLPIARAFYDPIVRAAGARWTGGRDALAFEGRGQRVELLQRRRPRVLGWAGHHVALSVPAGRLHALTDELRAAGHTLNWWREDHPAEREPTAYASDPSGNLVQLVGSTDTAPLLGHVTVPVHDVELGEKFYRVILGARLDYYHGWRTEDTMEAKAWANADDPCAPWTRVSKYAPLYHVTVARPVVQVFLRLGEQRLGMVVATKHVHEPPEETLRGTPAVILGTPKSAREVAAALPTLDVTTSEAIHVPRGIPFRRIGNTVYLRDRSGNFVQLVCAGA